MKNRALIEIVKIGFIITGISILNESCSKKLEYKLTKKNDIYINKFKKNINKKQLFKSSSILLKWETIFINKKKNKEIIKEVRNIKDKKSFQILKKINNDKYTKVYEDAEKGHC